MENVNVNAEVNEAAQAQVKTPEEVAAEQLLAKAAAWDEHLKLEAEKKEKRKKVLLVVGMAGGAIVAALASYAKGKTDGADYVTDLTRPLLADRDEQIAALTAQNEQLRLQITTDENIEI